MSASMECFLGEHKWIELLQCLEIETFLLPDQLVYFFRILIKQPKTTYYDIVQKVKKICLENFAVAWRIYCGFAHLKK